MNASAIPKQLACAAAMSSSGFVPGWPSSPTKRLDAEYGWSLIAPLWVETAPLPSLPAPRHTAVLERSMACPPIVRGGVPRFPGILGCRGGACRPAVGLAGARLVDGQEARIIVGPELEVRARPGFG